MTPPAALRAPLLFLAISLASAAQADAVLQQAEQLLNQRQPASAWVLLSPLEDERGGDPAYDYLLGRAALDTGRATEALFAFERCLAVNPKDGPCRVQMARAHMAAGETRSARNELETVKASEPPAEVAQLVSQYLGALGVREMREQRRLDAWLQLGLGADSNVNAATDRDQVAFPGFGGLVFDLSPSAQKQDSAFYNGEVGVSGEYAASPGFRWVGDARLSGRGYTDVGSFNNVVLDAGAGGAWRIGPHSTLLKLQAQHFELDSSPSATRWACSASTSMRSTTTPRSRSTASTPPSTTTVPTRRMPAAARWAPASPRRSPSTPAPRPITPAFISAPSAARTRTATTWSRISSACAPAAAWASRRACA